MVAKNARQGNREDIFQMAARGAAALRTRGDFSEFVLDEVPPGAIDKNIFDATCCYFSTLSRFLCLIQILPSYTALCDLV